MAIRTTFSDDARIAIDTLAKRATSVVSPSIRLGVTGLSRAGKTVFISSLVHNLLHGGRLPLFEAAQSGRIARAYLQPQPDDAVPRFQYEEHIATMLEKRVWPDSTRAISQLRVTIEYESASLWSKVLPGGTLSLDIVDYPGEWLLDLPLLNKDFSTFSQETADLAKLASRADLAQQWLALADSVDPDAPADEALAQRLFSSFAEYLRLCKNDTRALSTLPPGRFLMPGDLEGSPALTFSPLIRLSAQPKSGSMQAMMERRYEAYKTHVVRPFFRNHVARLDRQIVLIDVMQAMNAGQEAVLDLERALADILSCFRAGKGNFLTDLFVPRIDRILIAATKADHIHHESHRRLEAIVRRLTERVIARADLSGAGVEVLAMAAVRATREASIKERGDTLPVIVGTPMQGETIAGETFDGEAETAIFPGDLPEKPASVFQQPEGAAPAPIRFVRFRPPRLEETEDGIKLSLPHIRLDRAMQYLIGDHLV